MGVPNTPSDKDKVIEALADMLGMTDPEKAKLESNYGKQKALEHFSLMDFEEGVHLAGDLFKGP